ncbi:hypothetical protein ScalyP_jg3727 [Parmales sp. scaly parma]|nr:hypothetical protein ScalyP_jg3727 [Parmales sp. scaly parma]
MSANNFCKNNTPKYPLGPDSSYIVHFIHFMGASHLLMFILVSMGETYSFITTPSFHQDSTRTNINTNSIPTPTPIPQSNPLPIPIPQSNPLPITNYPSGILSPTIIDRLRPHSMDESLRLSPEATIFLNTYDQSGPLACVKFLNDPTILSDLTKAWSMESKFT